MKTYEFTLRFALSNDTDLGKAADRLYKSGCDDALIGIGVKGRLALNFVRQAESACRAFETAIADVRKAYPDAKLIEAAPDFVGLSDIAQLLNCSRQNVRKLSMTKSLAPFPLPIHEGTSGLWHLDAVLSWIEDSRKQTVNEALWEVSSVAKKFNLAKELNSLSDSDLEQIRQM